MRWIRDYGRDDDTLSSLSAASGGSIEVASFSSDRSDRCLRLRARVWEVVEVASCEFVVAALGFACRFGAVIAAAAAAAREEGFGGSEPVEALTAEGEVVAP